MRGAVSFVAAQLLVVPPHQFGKSIRHRVPVDGRQLFIRRTAAQFVAHLLPHLDQGFEDFEFDHRPVGLLLLARRLETHDTRPLPRGGHRIAQVGKFHHFLHFPKPVRPVRKSFTSDRCPRAAATVERSAPAPQKPRNLTLAVLTGTTTPTRLRTRRLLTSRLTGLTPSHLARLRASLITRRLTGLLAGLLARRLAGTRLLAPTAGLAPGWLVLSGLRASGLTRLALFGSVRGLAGLARAGRGAGLLVGGSGGCLGFGAGRPVLRRATRASGFAGGLAVGWISRISRIRWI